MDSGPLVPANGSVVREMLPASGMDLGKHAEGGVEIRHNERGRKATALEQSGGCGTAVVARVAERCGPLVAHRESELRHRIAEPGRASISGRAARKSAHESQVGMADVAQVLDCTSDASRVVEHDRAERTRVYRVDDDDRCCLRRHRLARWYAVFG